MCAKKLSTNMLAIPIDGERLRELLLAKGGKNMRAVAREMGMCVDGVGRAIRVNAISKPYADAIRARYGIKLWEYSKDWREVACMGLGVPVTRWQRAGDT